MAASSAEFWTSSFTKDYLQKMYPLDSQIDRIGFCSAIDSRIVFSSEMFKCTDETFRMEYDYKGPSDFSIKRKSMLARLYRDFRNSLLNTPLHFERSNSGLAMYIAVVQTSKIKTASENLLWII
jgi:hypothetical protein